MAKKTLKERAWLKFDPEALVYSIDLFKSGRRLRKTLIDESAPTARLSKTKAIELGDRIVSDWLLQVKPKAEKMTFKDCAELVLKSISVGLRGSTYRKAEGIFRVHLIPFFGALNIREVSSVDWVRYVEGLKKSKPDIVLSEKLKYFLKTLRWAHSEALIDRVPKVTLPRRLGAKFEGMTLTPAEESRVLASDLGDISLIVKMALATGMRKNEILQLEWWQLEKKPGWVVLPDEKVKTWKGRNVPLPEAIHKALISRPRVGRFVFCDSSGERPWLGARQAWDDLKRLCEVRPKFRFHDLRHSALSKKLSVEKRNPLLVCRCAGLDPKVALNVYVHPSDEDLRSEFLDNPGPKTT